MTSTVTPRDRVLTALAHRQPDVTPWQIDLTIDARARTAAYLGDDDFMAQAGNHLAGWEDGEFVEVRPGFWRDQFGITWNRTIAADIGNVEPYLLPEPTLAHYDFPAPTWRVTPVCWKKLVAEHPQQFRYASVGFSMFERAGRCGAWRTCWPT